MWPIKTQREVNSGKLASFITIIILSPLFHRVKQNGKLELNNYIQFF
jgi:hypothetical protein